MCGITGIHFKNPDYIKTKKNQKGLEDFFDFLLLGIEGRGRDATGFVAVDNKNHVVLQKKNVSADKFIKERRPLPEGLRTILGHTRFATQGRPENWHNNHPVYSGSTFVTHNGTIANDDQLFKSEELKRTAEVDTEVISALLWKYGLDEAPKALDLLKGGFACAAIDPVRSPGRLLLFKGRNYPLTYFEDDNVIVWSSLGNAIEFAWEKVMGKDSIPGWKDRDWLAEGDLLDIQGDAAELKRHAFGSWKPTTAPRSPHGHGPTGFGSSQYYTQADDDEDTEDWCGNVYYMSRYRGRVPAHQSDEVKKRRDLIEKLEEEGKEEARSWDNRHLLEPAERPTKWSFCAYCDRTIHPEDVKDTEEGTEICLDCISIDLDNQDRSEYQLDIDPQLAEELENWAETEVDLHNRTLLKMHDLTGLSPDAIDYLVFRDTYYDKSNDKRKKLKEDIKLLYEDMNNEVWEQVTAPNSDPDDLVIEDGAIIPSMVASTHVMCAAGNHSIYEDCEACGKGLPKPKKELPAPEPTAIISKHHDYRYCTKSSKSNLCPGCFRCKQKNDKGACMIMGCLRRAKTWQGDFRWCAPHYEECQYQEECALETKGTTPLGVRYCHFHIRGVKAIRMDGDKGASWTL